jgi:hypothetical protein
MSTTPATHVTTHTATRLFFLDWVRIIAFFVLILYHVGMYYVSWGWHVKSPAASDALAPVMMLSSPWRLSLLFLVSGVASGSMLARLEPLRFMRQRSRRLLVPLLFGMLVIVPPQSYCEVVEKVGYRGSYLDFMRLYLSAYHGFCRDGCLILPTWNHLWFVAYLWAYTVVLGLLTLALGARFDQFAHRLGRQLDGWRIVLLPAAVLGLARILMEERFPQTHALVDDWYSHVNYLLPFLLGALMSRVPAFWPRVQALRWTCLALATGGWALLMIGYAVAKTIPQDGLFRLLCLGIHSVYALLAWSAILAACGFARRHLDEDGPARRYLAPAVFPVYILHQTVIVVLARTLKPLHIQPGLEGMLLIVLTTVSCFAGYELVRRVAALRPLFGLGAAEPASPAQPALAADPA